MVNKNFTLTLLPGVLGETYSDVLSTTKGAKLAGDNKLASSERVMVGSLWTGWSDSPQSRA